MSEKTSIRKTATNEHILNRSFKRD